MAKIPSSGIGKRSGDPWTYKGGKFRIQGIENVTQNINAQLKLIQGKSLEGLLSAAIMVLEDAEKTPPTVPKDLGQLRASKFTLPFKVPVTNDPYVELGYGARHAAAVHEMVGADFSGGKVRYGPGPGRKRITAPTPGAGAKFFQASLARNASKIIHIVAAKSKI